MLNYTFKNIKSQMTKQGITSLLLVVNIIVSCLVICFSCGVYRNYKLMIKEGEPTDMSQVTIGINDECLSTVLDKPRTSEMTVGMLKEFISKLSPDTLKSSYFDVFTGFYNELYLDEQGNPGFSIQSPFKFTVIDGVYRCVGEIADMHFFTEEQYANGEKVVAIGTKYYDISERISGTVINSETEAGSKYVIYYVGEESAIPADKKTTIINGEEFRIIKSDIPYALEIPFTALPDDTPLCGKTYIQFDTDITKAQYEDIKKCVASSAIGQYGYVKELTFIDESEIYYYRTILLISVLISVLAAINMAIIYRYILEKRSKELAIYRICGCTKRKATAMYLLEGLIINAPLFALFEVAYHKLIMPRLTDMFPHMKDAYSLKLYAVIFGIYVAASLIVMLTMIAFTVSKHSLASLKNKAKASSKKFGIMKLFEVLQLAAVLGIIVCVVSAIESRYSLFNPFEDELQREGYFLNGKGVSTSETTEEFKSRLPGCEFEMVCYDEFTSDNAQLDEFHAYGLLYDDEYYDSYIPPMNSGVWLNEVEKNSDAVPVVLSYTDKYEVGDEFTQTFVLGTYDIDGNLITNDANYPVTEHTMKVRVVGILKDNINIQGFDDGDSTGKTDYRSIYDIYNNSFEQKIFIFAREKDWTPARGVSNYPADKLFIFTDNCTPEQKEVADKYIVESYGDTAKPLTEVYDNSVDYIYSQMYTLFPIALCIFILTVISAVSINAIYTKRQLRNYAIFYICGARWKTCALRSLKNSAITCAVSVATAVAVLLIGKETFLSETVLSFGIWQILACTGVIVLYLALSIIMPITIIGKAQPRDVLKEE